MFGYISIEGINSSRGIKKYLNQCFLKLSQSECCAHHNTNDKSLLVFLIWSFEKCLIKPRHITLIINVFPNTIVNWVHSQLFLKFFKDSNLK